MFVKPRSAFVEKPSVDRKSTRLNSSHDQISYAVFCLKKKKQSHVGELGVGASRGNDAAREQLVLGRCRAEGAVGMPQPIARLDKPAAIIGRPDLDSAG